MKQICAIEASQIRAADIPGSSRASWAGRNHAGRYCHTGATLLAGAGVPLWQISGMLGHSYSCTTELYAKHGPEHLHEAIAELESVFGN